MTHSGRALPNHSISYRPANWLVRQTFGAVPNLQAVDNFFQPDLYVRAATIASALSNNFDHNKTKLFRPFPILCS
jgi:hypothetical protein